MGVQVIDNGNPLEAFLTRWMTMRQQEQDQKRALAQQDKQFQMSHGLDAERTGAVVGQAKANTVQTEQDTRYKRGMSILENFQKWADPHMKEGRRDEVMAAFERLRSENPDVAEFTSKAFQSSSPLQGDIAAANTAKFTADQTGVAAGGSQDAQARAFTQEAALGRPMSAHQFGDQQQRQSTPQAYGDFVKREGNALPTAGQQLQANTMVQVGREQNASQQQIAGARLAAETSGKQASGDPVLSRDMLKLGMGFDNAEMVLKNVETAMKEFSAAARGMHGGAAIDAKKKLDAAIATATFALGQAYGQTGHSMSDKDRQAFEKSLTPGTFWQVARPETIDKVIGMTRQNIKQLRQQAEAMMSSRGGQNTGAKTVSMDELRQLGKSPEEAAANGYQVIP
jgi:hypothetical protein